MSTSRTTEVSPRPLLSDEELDEWEVAMNDEIRRYLAAHVSDQYSDSPSAKEQAE